MRLTVIAPPLLLKTSPAAALWLVASLGEDEVEAVGTSMLAVASPDAVAQQPTMMRPDGPVTVATDPDVATSAEPLEKPQFEL